MFAVSLRQKSKGKSENSVTVNTWAWPILQENLIMTINFVCQSCKKKVKAPEKSGGKWGNCPHCNLKCYIPLPPSPDDEELKLIPIDEEEEARLTQEKMKESRSLQLDILHETMGADDDAVGFSFNEQDKKRLWKTIITYLRLMADGELDEAQQKVGEIVRYGDHAKEIIAEIARSEEPEPELADIAGAVLKGMIKNLISEINAN
jgi:hypothetical protein